MPLTNQQKLFSNRRDTTTGLILITIKLISPKPNYLVNLSYLRNETITNISRSSFPTRQYKTLFLSMINCRDNQLNVIWTQSPPPEHRHIVNTCTLCQTTQHLMTTPSTPIALMACA